MTSPLRLLMLEDSADDVELVLRELRRHGFEVESRVVSNEADFRRELARSEPELILADYSLPGYDGLSAMGLARALRPGTPFVFVSGAIGEELAIEALQCGATDYVLKDRLARLGPAVRRALQEARARRRYREADAANRAKTAFLASMSHEIRTPMNGVMGILELLAQSPLTDEQIELVQTALESGRTLLGIIDDILDLSRIEADRLEIHRAPFGMATTVETLCESLLPVAVRAEVDLRLFVAPDVPEQVIGDELRLRQVLYNLLGNAIKFSAGGPDVRGLVALRVATADGTPFRLVFHVIDNGIGMAPETATRVFEAFIQGEQSTVRRFGGTGLGLAICRRLVELMAGRVTVESTEGSGSTFTVELPFERPGDQPAVEPAILAGLDCLLLATPAMDTETLRVYLEQAGARVQIAADAESAAAIVTGLAGPVVVIVDVGRNPPALPAALAGLPGVRGLALTHRGHRRAHVEAGNLVSLDGRVLRRRNLLQAVAVAAQFAEPAAAAAVVSPPSVREVDSGAPLLVAEDDAVNRMVIRKQLELLGRSADVVEDGREALEMWRAKKYSLLLTDLNMPRLDGYALTAAIREEEAHQAAAGGPQPHLPIVALTAHALQSEAERVRAAGMDGYLTKPVSLNVLRETLDRLLKKGTLPVS